VHKWSDNAFDELGSVLSLEVFKREVEKSTGREQQKQTTTTPNLPTTQNQTTNRITKQIESLFTTASFPGSFAKFV
jgi:hypothetical protein